jgi:hypothetical protein
MYIKGVCAWGGKFMGIKECEGSSEGRMLISHSICPDCKRKVTEEAEEVLRQNTQCANIN